VKWQAYVCLCGRGGERRHWTCEKRQRELFSGRPMTMASCTVAHRKRNVAVVHAAGLNERKS
jgi:hypothetical protein